jgi:hypothetical protein
MTYDLRRQKLRLLPIQIKKGLPIMKFAIRIFALSVVVAGGAAAATTSKTAPVVLPSHQSATARMPVPVCSRWFCAVDPANQNNQ